MVNVITNQDGRDESESREQALEQCERTLYSCLHHELEAGAVIGTQLQKIRAEELFRVAGAETFEVYCRRYLELDVEQVRRFAAIAGVVETLHGAGLELPYGEEQALLLSKIPRDRWIGCWKTILAYCTKEDMLPSDALVRRAMRFETARAKASGKSTSPRESVAGESTKGPAGNDAEAEGVQVDFDL